MSNLSFLGGLAQYSVLTGATGPTGPIGATGVANVSTSSYFSLRTVDITFATSSISYNVDQKFSQIRGIGFLRSNNFSLFERVGIRFNDDTGDNYGFNLHYVQFSGSIMPSGSYNHSSVSGGDLGMAIGNRGLTGTLSFFEFEIPFYTGTYNYKTYSCYSCSFFPSGVVDGRHLFATMIQGIWMNTNPITKITLYQMSGFNFETGSSVIFQGEN